MTIIDLRPYAKQPPRKPLITVLLEHIKQVRGSAQIIYSVPDWIILTKSQYADVKDFELPHNIQIDIEDDPTD
jgi:hypothetical protein